MITITEEKFDQLLDELGAMTYRCQDWFPSVEEIKKYIEPQIKENQLMLKFALWMLETAGAPSTDEEKQARRYLMSLTNDSINIV